jgi:arabinogalactan endo-1,4-beta-galactosidase
MQFAKYSDYLSGIAKNIHFNAFVNMVGSKCHTNLAMFTLADLFQLDKSHIGPDLYSVGQNTLGSGHRLELAESNVSR